MTDWHTEKCTACYGTGQVSDYSACDFEGPKECGHCWGSGNIWISPKGRIALYPGGPFLGSIGAKELERVKAIDQMK